MVYGAAHNDENKKLTGGKGGDQRQTSIPDYSGEVSLQTSVDSRTYTVYRAINTDYATKMAELMITACNNSHIGYAQDTRDGIWTYGVNTTTDCNCDCSSLVAYCVYKGTGKNLGSFATSAEPSALEGSGLFNKVGTYSSGMTIYNGDIFVCPGHHTLMAVQGNPRTGTDTELTGTVSDGTAYTASGTGYTAADLNTEVLNQFVITIDRNTPNPDYKTMLENRVSGVIIEAGYLYNAQHTVVSNPRNPYIQQQCKNAVSANMPYGLYWDVKARTVDEAKSELYQLQFLIRKYPPVMGIWLHLALTAKTSTNNKIVDTYATELEILGLKGYKGFYVTAEELEKITWEDYEDDWWLWIVNPVDDASEVDSLLQPYFFTISGEEGSAAANPDYNSGTGTTSTGTTSSGTLSTSSGSHKTISQSNGYYLSDDNSSSGRLVIGNSRMVQLYAYNNYQYFSNASFVAVWGGNYYGSYSSSINSSSRISTMKSYITKSLQSVGKCKVLVEPTVNDYNGGSGYQSAANHVISLAKDLSSVSAKYNGSSVSPNVYVMTLVGGKGKDVSSYNSYLRTSASSNNYQVLDISSCMGGDNSGYLSDGLHFNDTTLKNIWCNVVA